MPVSSVSGIIFLTDNQQRPRVQDLPGIICHGVNRPVYLVFPRFHMGGVSNDISEPAIPSSAGKIGGCILKSGLTLQVPWNRDPYNRYGYQDSVPVDRNRRYLVPGHSDGAILSWDSRQSLPEQVHHLPWHENRHISPSPPCSQQSLQAAF